MNGEPAYRKFYYCHTCQKYTEGEYVESHKLLNHKIESYLTLPTQYDRNTPKYEKKQSSEPRLDENQ